MLRIRDSNDQGAFRQLFDMYYQEMVVSAKYLLKDEVLAHDAAQEAFVALWNNRANIDPSQSIRSYLKRSTINRSLNLIKSRSHHQGAGPEELVLQEAQEADPHALHEQQELSQVIKAAVHQLPDRCRQIFVLSKYEGLSHKEIASQMDISPKTVENQMTIALRSLRGLLGPYLNRTSVFFIALWGKVFLYLYS